MSIDADRFHGIEFVGGRAGTGAGDGSDDYYPDMSSFLK